MLPIMKTKVGVEPSRLINIAVSARERLIGNRQPQKMSHAASTIRLFAIYAVLVSVVLNASGPLLFKMARAGQAYTSLITLFFHYETSVGILLYGLSALSWLWVLSRAHLSFAYPILGLTFPIIVGLSAILFAEHVSPLRWLGVGIIVLGV